MPEPSCHTSDRAGARNRASAHGEETPASDRVAQDEPVPATSAVGAADARKNSVSVRQAEAILAGLPAHVMDELVSDLAEAVVAILLDRERGDTGHSDDEGSDLREI